MKFEYFPKSTLEADCNEIIKALEILTSKQVRINLLNFFKELPVASKAPIAPFDESMFLLEPNETQLLVMSEKQKTIITDVSDRTILAICRRVSLEKRQAIVGDFSYIKLLADKRESFRVRLENPVNVVVETPSGKQSGMLKDISLTGCRVDLFNRAVEPGNVTVSLKMFDQETKSVVNISATAELVRIEAQKIPVRCGIRFELNREVEDQLLKFINQRQLQIIKQLKDGKP